MNWEAVSAIATLLGATGVIASLLYLDLAVQVRFLDPRRNRQPTGEKRSVPIGGLLVLTAKVDPRA